MHGSVRKKKPGHILPVFRGKAWGGESLNLSCGGKRWRRRRRLPFLSKKTLGEGLMESLHSHNVIIGGREEVLTFPLFLATDSFLTAKKESFPEYMGIGKSRNAVTQIAIIFWRFLADLDPPKRRGRRRKKSCSLAEMTKGFFEESSFRDAKKP